MTADSQCCQDVQCIKNRETASVTRSYAIDDYEKVRTHPLRTIRQQVPMLEDALYALRNGSENVTEEFLERVIEALVKEDKHLSSQKPTF